LRKQSSIGLTVFDRNQAVITSLFVSIIVLSFAFGSPELCLSDSVLSMRVVGIYREYRRVRSLAVLGLDAVRYAVVTIVRTAHDVDP
jgi:hypothetical protein